MRAGRLLAAGLALAGLAFLAQGSWIYVKAAVAQRLISSAWARERAGEKDVKPWAWADTHPVARLTLRGQGQPLMVLDGAGNRNLAFGPVHDPASVLPGMPGNSVIEGHRDTHFKVLRDVAPGDAISVELADGRKVSFVVTNRRVVDSRRSRILLDSTEPRLTLVTCYPFDAVRPGGPLRYVVSADLAR